MSVSDNKRRNVRWVPRFGSFRAKLMVLLALAVSVPALLTCLILGIQLDRQARTLFANTLSASLETFSLILRDNERNLNEGLARAATDNTLQITLELEIKAQLAKYIEAQRQVLRIGFLGVYDRNAGVIAFTGDSGVWNGQWKLVASGKYGDDCVATQQVDQQLVKCNGTMYLVSVVQIDRPQDANLGDGLARAGRRQRTARLPVGRHPARRPCTDRLTAGSPDRSSADLGRRRDRLFEYSRTGSTTATGDLRVGERIRYR